METFEVPKQWGEKYHTGIKEHNGYMCPHCGARPIALTGPEVFGPDFGGWFRVVVGFSHEIPQGSARSRHPGDERVIGCFIVGCPKCFEKYWMHVTVGTVKCAIKSCPNWPK